MIPTPTVESCSIDSLDRWWASLPDRDAWDTTLRSVQGREDVDDWLKSLLVPPVPRTQALFRQWRALHSYEVAQDEATRMLVGWPISVQAGGAPGFARLADELAAGLSHLLLPHEVCVRMHPMPVPVGVLHAAKPSQLLRWTRQEDWPAVLTGAPLEQGPYVWIGALHAVQGDAPWQDLFVSINAKASALTRTLAVRVEALLEEDGCGCRVFPLTALWNAASVARLTHARIQLHSLRKTELLQGRRGDNSSRWTVRDDSGAERFAGDFEEETDADLSALLR